MSAYAARAFGFETFGTVYGLASCIAGLSGLILRPIDLLNNGPLFNGDYTTVNIIGTGLGLVTAIGVLWRIYTSDGGRGRGRGRIVLD